MRDLVTLQSGGQYSIFSAGLSIASAALVECCQCGNVASVNVASDQCGRGRDTPMPPGRDKRGRNGRDTRRTLDPLPVVAG